jgi:hypothetical protein
VAKNKRSALLSAAVASPGASAGLGPYEPFVQFDRLTRSSFCLWLGIHAVEFAKEHPPEFALILREMAQGQNLSKSADFSIAEFPLRRSLKFFKDHLAFTFSPISTSRRDSGHGACFPNTVAARQAGKEVAGYPPGLIGEIRHPGPKWLSSQQVVPAVEFVCHASLALDCAQ